MKETEVIIKNKLSSNIVLTIGGVISTLGGLFLLSNPHEITKGGLPYWIYGIILFPFGLLAIFTILDFLQLIIRKDELEIISLFRVRIIQKSDIQGYGIEKYKGKTVSGERIRIFCKKGSYKFHTSQLESIDEIKKFVKGKEVQKNAFAKERIETIVVIIMALCVLILASPYQYKKFTSSNKEDIQVIGIPAKFIEDMNIVDENGSQVRFELKEYQGFLFVANKSNIPTNMKSTNKELVIIISNKKYIEQLSNKEKQKGHTQGLISVDEIIILE